MKILLKKSRQILCAVRIEQSISGSVARKNSNTKFLGKEAQDSQFSNSSCPV